MLEQPLGYAISSQTWADQALCALDMGDLDTAAESVATGLEAVSAMSHLARPWLLATGSLVASARGDADEADRLAAEAAAYAADNGIRIVEPFTAYAGAEVAAARSGSDEAVAAFQGAADTAGKMDQLPLLRRVHKAAARVLRTAGRGDAAEVHEKAAARVGDEIASTFTDAELRASYLARVRAVD